MNERALVRTIALLIASVLAVAGHYGGALAQCAFTSGSTGADGPFNPAANVTLPLPPDGIFNFTTVNIPAGVTVRFQRNAKNTPVFMLAAGDVTISGLIDVSGSAAGSDPVGAMAGAGGPGGFDGGMGGTACGGAGGGPGGGPPACGGVSPRSAGGGSFRTAGINNCTAAAGPVYGNNLLTPLIGGSGGGGGNGGTDFGAFGGGGGGGGGAILIASSGIIRLNRSPSIQTLGGGGACGTRGVAGAGGAGGSIRLVATVIAGGGGMSAQRGNGCGGCSPGGDGWMRVEVCQNNFTGSISGPVEVGAPRPAFLAGIPTLTITSVAGAPAPSMPTGSFNLPPDISLPVGTTTATVQLAATEIPTGTTIAVTVTPNKGQPSTVMSTPLAGTQSNSTASADITLATGVSIISAQVTMTVAQAGSAPILIGSIDGEKIEKIRVAAAYGGPSSLTYITASGREVPADQVLSREGGRPAPKT